MPLQGGESGEKRKKDAGAHKQAYVWHYLPDV